MSILAPVDREGACLTTTAPLGAIFGKRPMKRIIVSLLALGMATAAQAQAQPTGAPFADQIVAFGASDQANPPAACSTIFVGSSTIRRWESLVADMAPLPAVNRGFGGARMDQVNVYFDQTVGRHKPRAIVLYAGGNDINAGESPDQVFDDVQTFMFLKTSKLGPTPVYLIANGVVPARIQQRAEVETLNAKLEALADQRDDLVYINPGPLMFDGQGKLKPVFVEDGIHMNRQGYELWIPLLKQTLSQPSPTQAPGC
jgi:lysophospholipase L1-like esterase